MGLFDHLFKNKPPSGEEKSAEQGAEQSGGNKPAEPVQRTAPPQRADPSAFLHPKNYVPRGAPTLTPSPRHGPAPAGKPSERKAAAGPGATAPEEIVLTLGDVLSRIPTHYLKLGTHDPKRELRFRITDLSSDIARGRAAVPLSRIAQLLPDIFVKGISRDEDTEVRLPLQKLVEQVGLLRSQPKPVEKAVRPPSPVIVSPVLPSTAMGPAKERLSPAPAGPKAAGTIESKLKPVGTPPPAPVIPGESTSMPPPPLELKPSADSASAPFVLGPRPPAAPPVVLAEAPPVVLVPAASEAAAPALVLAPAVVETSPAVESVAPAPEMKFTQPEAESTELEAKVAEPAGAVSEPAAVVSESLPPVPPAAPAPVEPARVEGDWGAPAAAESKVDAVPPAAQIDSKAMETEPPVDEPQVVAPVEEPGVQANEQSIQLSLAVILRQCPPEIIVGQLPHVDDSVKIALPFAPIDRQLIMGQVEVSALRFVAALPESYRKYFVAKVGVQVPIPLEEVFENLPAPAQGQTPAPAVPPPIVFVSPTGLEAASSSSAPEEKPPEAVAVPSPVPEQPAVASALVPETGLSVGADKLDQSIPATEAPPPPPPAAVVHEAEQIPAFFFFPSSVAKEQASKPEPPIIDLQASDVEKTFGSPVVSAADAVSPVADAAVAGGAVEPLTEPPSVIARPAEPAASIPPEESTKPAPTPAEAEPQEIPAVPPAEPVAQAAEIVADVATPPPVTHDPAASAPPSSEEPTKLVLPPPVYRRFIVPPPIFGFTPATVAAESEATAFVEPTPTTLVPEEPIKSAEADEVQPAAVVQSTTPVESVAAESLPELSLDAKTADEAPAVAKIEVDAPVVPEASVLPMTPAEALPVEPVAVESAAPPIVAEDEPARPGAELIASAIDAHAPEEVSFTNKLVPFTDLAEVLAHETTYASAHAEQFDVAMHGGTVEGPSTPAEAQAPVEPAAEAASESVSENPIVAEKKPEAAEIAVDQLAVESTPVAEAPLAEELKEADQNQEADIIAPNAPEASGPIEDAPAAPIEAPAPTAEAPVPAVEAPGSAGGQDEHHAAPVVEVLAASAVAAAMAEVVTHPMHQPVADEDHPEPAGESTAAETPKAADVESAEPAPPTESLDLPAAEAPPTFVLPPPPSVTLPSAETEIAAPPAVVPPPVTIAAEVAPPAAEEPAAPKLPPPPPRLFPEVRPPAEPASFEVLAPPSLPSLPLRRFDQDAIQALFMTEETLDLPKISRLAAALPGVHACVIATRDQAVTGGNLPDGFDLAALLGLAPRVGEAAGRMPIGQLKHFTLYGDAYSVSFFERNGLSLCAVHRPRSFVPGVREKLVALADELSR